MKKDIYDTLFHIGSCTGCHQMPKRSFFFKGKQFPVCARCTGAFIGYTAGGILYFFLKIPVAVCTAFCYILFLDWLFQYLDILESTNIRRLMTGILCGGGLVQLYFGAIEFILKTVIKRFAGG